MKGLLFITHQTAKYNYIQSVEIALEGGCRQIQLRMKDIEKSEVERVGRIVKELCDKYQANLYIDDHVDVCKNLSASGVHLGKSDMPPHEARRELGNGYIIGGTANTFEDIQNLYAQGVDYIGLGPFRYTTTKEKLSPVLGISGYKDIIRQCADSGIKLPIIAIGGITAADIPVLMEIGVQSIALSSAILQAGNPVEETKKLVEIINKYQ